MDSRIPGVLYSPTPSVPTLGPAPRYPWGLVPLLTIRLLVNDFVFRNNYRVRQPRTTCGVWGAWCGKCLMAGPWRPWVSLARLGQYPKAWPRPTWSWWPRTPPNDPTPLPRSAHAHLSFTGFYKFEIS